MPSIAARAYARAQALASSERLGGLVPARMRETLYLRRFALAHIPLLGFLWPSVEELTDDRCVVRIPLTRRSKNHLGSLYFAALAAGADAAGGLIAMRLIARSGGRTSLVFKDIHGEFLSRAEGDTDFTCEDGQAIHRAFAEAVRTGERQNVPVTVVATVPGKSDKPVARFVMTLSLKARPARR